MNGGAVITNEEQKIKTGRDYPAANPHFALMDPTYPNYWGDMPMAVYTFLKRFDWGGKTIHPFCTHEGSGLSGTERKIQHLCKGASVGKGLAIQGSYVDGAASVVAKWVKG